jgi:hypothetical protein
LRNSDAQRTTSTDGYVESMTIYAARVGDVRRVGSSVAIVEPIASRYPAPSTADISDTNSPATTRVSVNASALV